MMRVDSCNMVPPPPGFSPRTRAVVLAALLVLAIGPLAAGQQQPEEEPEELVFGHREKVPPFALQNLKGYLDLSMNSERDTATAQHTKTTQTTDTLFREILGLSADSWIVHPNIVDLKLSVELGLTQELTSSDSQSGTGNGTILGYDVSATFLRQSVAPLTLYARQTNETFTQPFAPSLTSVQNTIGGRWNITAKECPTTLELYRSIQDLTGVNGVTGPANTAGASAYHLEQDVFQWHSQPAIGKDQTLTWDYSHNGQTETTQIVHLPNHVFTMDEAILAHAVNFGSKKDSSLTSTFDLFAEDGNEPFDFDRRFRWNEDMRLRHSDALLTEYHFMLNDDQHRDNTQALEQGTIGFQHQLFSSLFTTGTLGVSQMTIDPEHAQTRDVFGDLGWDYRKRIPYGALTLNLNLGFNNENNTARLMPTQIIDEQHTFTLLTDPHPDLIVLNQRLISASSIVVKQNFAPFAIVPPAGNYSVATFPDRVEITRNPFSLLLPDGAAVKISYAILPAPASTIETDHWGYGARYEFNQGPLNGLAFYYRERDQTQTITTPRPAAVQFVPDNITDRIFGVDYRVRELTLNVERELYDSTISPYNATRFGGLINHGGPGGFLLGVGANYNIVDYLNPRQQNRFLNLTGRVEKQVTERLWGRASINYNSDTGDIFQGAATKGLDEELELRWHYGQTQVYLILRNTQVDTTGQGSQSQSAQLGIRRDF